jgi:hypothetical protein
MMPVRQELLHLSEVQLNDALANGARVVWIQPEHNLYAVVLELYVNPDVSPEEIVADFLAHVNPAVLEEKMLESPTLGEGPGKVALQALLDLLPGLVATGDPGAGS